MFRVIFDFINKFLSKFSSKMKICESIRKNYAILGITHMQSIQSNPFNKRISMAFIAIAAATFLHLMHVFRVASNLGERMESVTTTAGSAIISMVVVKMRTVCECISGFEDVIAQRE